MSFSALFFEFSIPLVNQELERKLHTGIDNGTEHYPVFSGSRINLLKIYWSGISKRLMSLGHVMREWNPWSRTKRTDFPNFWTLISKWSGAPDDNFRKISVRKTIWYLEFSEHCCKISCSPASPRIFEHLKNGTIAHF